MRRARARWNARSSLPVGGSDDGGAKRGDAFDGAVDDVARIEEEILRVGLADRDTARGAGGEHVAGLDGNGAREMLEDVGHLPDLVARVDPHALLAVHGARDPQVVRIADLVHGHDLRTEGPETRRVLRSPEARTRG